MAKDKSHRARPSADGILIWVVFAGLLIFRIANAVTIKTFFQPDEYFQSLEPAWRIAFGPESGAWITWEWREQLRSSMHPMLFAGVYRAAATMCEFFEVTPGVEAELLIASPKILQAGISATGDLFTWRLSRKVYGPGNNASLAALALTACSPWQWFCSVRTLSNSMETTLTVMALNYWPWTWFISQQNMHATEINLALSLTAAAVACILRPTNVVIWASISFTTLYRYGNLNKAVTLTRHAVIYGSAVLAVSVSVDRTYYGEWTFPPLKFLYFNVVKSLSTFYGTNRPDYYFTEGLPLLLTTALPFAAFGMWQALRPFSDQPPSTTQLGRQMRFILAAAVVGTVVTMSLISHKEVRFVYPLLPILHVLAAKPLAELFHPFPRPTRKARIGLMFLLLIANVGITIYVSLVHQRGVIDVLHYLRHEQEQRLSRHSMIESSSASAGVTVGFLMPCHSTPWRSHLVHPEIGAWALTCEPPLNVTIEDRATYQDEADVFYSQPALWINANMKSNIFPGDATSGESVDINSVQKRDWPEYLVFFEQLKPIIDEVLGGTRYRKCWRGFNTHWHDDRRRQGDVIVWCLKA